MSLKVFDLCCNLQHEFEGWFASAKDCEAQAKCRLIECPYCQSTQVIRKLSAPHVSRSASSVPAVSAEQVEQLKLAVRQGLRNMIQKAEDVGERFTEEALKIHHGEAEERSIRGQANAEQHGQLLDEGVDIFPIPAEMDPKKQH